MFKCIQVSSIEQLFNIIKHWTRETKFSKLSTGVTGATQRLVKYLFKVSLLVPPPVVNVLRIVLFSLKKW